MMRLRIRDKELLKARSEGVLMMKLRPRNKILFRLRPALPQDYSGNCETFDAFMRTSNTSRDMYRLIHSPSSTAVFLGFYSATDNGLYWHGVQSRGILLL